MVYPEKSTILLSVGCTVCCSSFIIIYKSIEGIHKRRMIMFEIDKAQFGSFLSARRKEKNFTQKELAEKLFISDKAVSKWERGLSLPDVSLLIPLADILGITVTELLEGKLMEEPAGADARQVEELVKKALAFSDKLPEASKEKKRKHWLIFGACTLAVLTEWLIGFLTCGSFRQLIMRNNEILVLQILSLFFGAYFWIRAKEQLPAYYDENRISFYNDGFFEMNIPGLCFNNRNWTHILRVGRIWSLLGATVFPFCYLWTSLLLPDGWYPVLSTGLLLLFSLGGLFVPIYIVGKKYE